DAVAERLKAAGFPAADIQVLGPDPKKHNVVARLRGSGAKRPLLLLAHLDVVEAKREDWSFDPFAFLEKDGFFYGRGTSDDKAMASILTANLIRMKEEGFKPNRDLILALTADEEGGRFNGVDWLVKNHRTLVDAALALNEGGSGQMKNGKYLINEVQASEKVYQDFRLESRNPGGHSSRPIRDNAIYHLADGLAKLERLDFPTRLGEVTRTYFERMAAFQSDAQVAADMRAAAQPEPDPQAVARLSAGSSYFNALMRTTCVATRLEGGHANNALPQIAAANVNCRILPGEAPEAVKQKIEETLADRKINVTFVDKATPSAPSPLTPEGMTAIESTTKTTPALINRSGHAGPLPLEQPDVRLADLVDEVRARFAGLRIVRVAVRHVVGHDADAEERHAQQLRDLRGRGRFHFPDGGPEFRVEPRDQIDLVVPHVARANRALDDFSA